MGLCPRGNASATALRTSYGVMTPGLLCSFVLGLVRPSLHRGLAEDASYPAGGDNLRHDDGLAGFLITGL